MLSVLGFNDSAEGSVASGGNAESLPRGEISLRNLVRVRDQLLDTITSHAIRATFTKYYAQMLSVLGFNDSAEGSVASGGNAE
jgi:hypothetical protein